MKLKKFKNNIYLVCFADGPVYEKTQELIKKTYNTIGKIDKIDIWNKSRIQKTEFYKNNSKIFKEKKGFGLWAWKPYIIYDLMKKVNENDFIIYMDCSSYYQIGFQYSVVPLLNYLHKNNLIIPGTHLFTKLYKLKYWAHDNTFKIMNVNKKIYGEKNMCQTSPSIWRKNKLCQEFLNDWIKYCTNYECIKYIDNIDKKIKSEPLLLRSQCDQSILSILIAKYNLKVPSPRGPFPDNFVTDEKKKDKKNGIHSYVRFLKNHNYLFKLAIDNKVPLFVNI